MTPATMALAELAEKGADVDVLRGRTLWVVQNFARRIAELALAGDWSSARVVSTTPETYPDAISDLLEEEEIGIVITRSDDVDELPAQLREEVTSSVEPVVIQLGGGAGEGLREKIRSAIGIDLLRE